MKPTKAELKEVKLFLDDILSAVVHDEELESIIADTITKRSQSMANQLDTDFSEIANWMGIAATEAITEVNSNDPNTIMDAVDQALNSFSSPEQPRNIVESNNETAAELESTAQNIVDGIISRIEDDEQAAEIIDRIMNVSEDVANEYDCSFLSAMNSIGEIVSEAIEQNDDPNFIMDTVNDAANSFRDSSNSNSSPQPTRRNSKSVNRARSPRRFDNSSSSSLSDESDIDDPELPRRRRSRRRRSRRSRQQTVRSRSTSSDGIRVRRGTRSNSTKSKLKYQTKLRPTEPFSLERDESAIYIYPANTRDKNLNLPKSISRGIRQICRYKDPVTKRYVPFPDDGSDDEEYEFHIKYQ